MYGDNHLLTMAKKPCQSGDVAGRAKRRRIVSDDLFATGRGEHAIRQRLTWCVTAAECGRICPRLVKGPGVASVACLDVASGSTLDLYPALADPAFRCPAGLF